MSTTTPGPWHVVDASRGSFRVVAAHGPGACIAMRAPWPHRAEESEANARLIAAAPELLASCRELREVAAACFRIVAALGEVAINALDAELTISGVRQEFGTRAALAIAKAEGK